MSLPEATGPPTQDPAGGRATRRAVLLAAAAAAAGCAAPARPQVLHAASGLVGRARRRPPTVPAATTPAAPTPGAGHPAGAPATAAQLLERATLPALCWHQLRDPVPGDTAYTRANLVCPPARFREQLDALAGAGVRTVTPDDHLRHLLTGAPLPPRAVLLSFDDSQGTQITEGLPELQRRGLTATFFIMTVVLGKPGWMARRDVLRLRDAGMTIAAHTWDHHRVDRYAGGDWAVQLDQPRALLEHLLGQPVPHFAYPYGAWAPEDFPHLRRAGYATAYQLSDRGLDRAAPQLTLRRLLVNSTWDGPTLLRHLEQARTPVAEPGT